MLRRQTTICREGWYYLAVVALVFGGATLKEVNLLLILAGMLLGPLLLNWQAVRKTLRGLRVERTLPTRISAGEPLSISLTLTNTRRRLSSWAVAVEDVLQREESAAGRRPSAFLRLRPSVLFPHVRPQQSRKGAYRGSLTARGRYRFGPITLSTRFPFGLFSRKTVLDQTETLVVLPRLGRLAQGWRARHREVVAGTGRRRRPGVEGDFYGTREWRHGDGLRFVHWRTSARLGKLVVRQFEHDESRDVALVLDLWQPNLPQERYAENVELAVSFTATALTDLCRQGGSSVYLGLYNEAPECLGGAASPTLLQGLLERLAVVEAQPDVPLSVLLDHTVRRIAKGAEVIVVSTRPVDLAGLLPPAGTSADSVLRDGVRRLRCIDASSERFSEFFQVD